MSVADGLVVLKMKFESFIIQPHEIYHDCYRIDWKRLRRTSHHGLTLPTSFN
jgi:hypothetical protein